MKRLTLFGQSQFDDALVLRTCLLRQQATLDQAGRITAQLPLVLLGGAGKMAKRRPFKITDCGKRSPLHQSQPVLLDQYRLRVTVIEAHQVGKPIGKQVRYIFRLRPGRRSGAQAIYFAIGQIFI